MSDTAILTNSHGVSVVKARPHCRVKGAVCRCGEELMVAPAVFRADHQPGDPVVLCADHGVHAFRFLDLVPGRQP